MSKMKKISLSLATALILLSSFTANAVLNMGGKTIFTGTLIKVLEPGPDIQAIIDSITDASVDKPYLIRLGPGVYDLGTTGIVMKEWVSIQGSGQEATTIIGAVSSGTADATSAIVAGVDNAALMDLTVENTGGGNISIAIYNNNASPHIERVTASASGGLNHSHGVFNIASSSPTMTNVTASALGVSNSYGVENSIFSSPTMTNVSASASSVSGSSYGVLNLSSSPTMTNVSASASSVSGNSLGVVNVSSSSPTMTNVSATGSGGTNSYGVYIESNSAPFVQDSVLEGNTDGLFINSDSPGARITNSKIIGGVTDGPDTTTNCLGNYKADLADVNC
jgi:hypothetical protein